MPYDPETPVGEVRLLIADVGGDSGNDFIFQDKEIEAFLRIRGGVVALAAATALRSIAANEAQVSKVITFLELKTDGAKVASALKDLAAELEAQADDDSDVEFAQIGADFFARRDLRLKAAGLEGDL